MIRVGLTGGIACGKSLVAGFFAERGIPVVNDDDAARDAVAPGTPGLAAVRDAFGAEYLTADGSLDRPKLGRLVFADDRLRRRLMEVTFPHIGRLLAARLAAAEGSGAPMLVCESALLIENGHADSWRPLIVVRSTPELQLARLRERNELTPAEAADRVRSQMPAEEKARLADHVIDNAGGLEHARAQFEVVFAALEAQARGSAAG